MRRCTLQPEFAVVLVVVTGNPVAPVDRRVVRVARGAAYK